MWKYIFQGTILPERAVFSLNDPISFEYKHEKSEMTGNIFISIYLNKVTLDFTSKEKVSNLFTLKNVMTEFISIIVDSASLNYIVGYHVDLYSLYNVNEQATLIFGADVPGLSSIENHEFSGLNISHFFSTALSGQYGLLQSVLSDFKDAILRPKDTALFCYRSIESLLRIFYFKKTGKQMKKDDKTNAIGYLEKTLNLDAQCIKKIRKLNGGVRHGEAPWVSGEDRILVLRLTQKIILRAFEFLNVTSATPTSFALLTLDSR